MTTTTQPDFSKVYWPGFPLPALRAMVLGSTPELRDGAQKEIARRLGGAK